MRLNLSVTRYFDPDEFAHLHWAWLILNGYLPYRDFFLYIMPGFAWLLSPILWLTGESINFLIASRVVVWLVYGACAAIVYQLSLHTRCESSPTSGVWTPLLAVLIFLTFPVTIDKTIDVRPDLVMLALYFASVMLVLPFITPPFPLFAKEGVRGRYFLSGILFGLSVLVLPKIIFGLPALLYLFFINQKRLNLFHGKGLTFIAPLAWWIAGAALVGLGFLSYLGIHNLIPQFLTSITRDSLAVTSGKISFSPLLLLTPYPLIYLTNGGPSLPWAVNTGVWILGLAGLMMLLRDPSTSVGMTRRLGIFWALFIAGNILFVITFPAPYVQYFLPLSVAASVLAGHAVGRSIKVIMIITIIMVISFFLQYRQRIAPGAENTEQLQVIRDVLQVTKPDESVYDMVGSYVFRPDGYYICCHPYGEFIQRLASRPGLERGLTGSLIARQTKFLVMDRVGFVFWQTPKPDKSFLLTNYLPMGDPTAPAKPLSKLYSLGQTFRCRQGACVQYDQHNKPASNRSANTFTILVPETYTVSLAPGAASVSIDGQIIRSGQSVFLTAGPHRFSTQQAVRSIRIQLAR